MSPADLVRLITALAALGLIMLFVDAITTKVWRML